MSNIIEWENEFCIGDELIDNQHQQLVGVINELYYAVKNKKGDDVALKIILKLLDYTVTHFNDEEAFFEDFDYPNKEYHKELHQQFVAQANDWHAEILSGQKPLSLDILHFLVDWLVNHIKVVDKELANYHV